MTYKITWFGIYAGDAIISIKETTFEGKSAIKFFGQVNSAKWFSRIYYVEDKATSIVDYDTLKPLLISVNYREGKKYRRKSQYKFDYTQNKVIAEGDNKSLQKPLPENFMEMFGAFNTLRMFPFKKEKKIARMVTDGRKLYQVSAYVEGYKTIPSIIGHKKCIIIHPEHIKMDLLGKDQNPEGISLYLTNDHKRIPLYVEGKIRIGSLIVNLKKIEKI